MDENKKFNFGVFGWLLVIYCFLTFLIFSLGNGTMNVAVALFEQRNGWNQTYLLSLQSIGAWTAIPFIFIFGQLYARGKIKLRHLILAAGLLYAIGIFLWGRVTNLAVFTVVFMICYITYPLWGTFSNNSLTNNWFPRKKGLIIGITTIGFPLGTGLGSMVFNILNGKVGFSNAYLIIGVVAAAICLFGFFTFTEYPEQRGQFPDNNRSLTSEQAKAEFEEGQKMLADSPWTVKNLLRTKEVWLLGIANSYLFAIASGCMGTMVPRLLSTGRYSPDQAVLFLLVAAFCACPGSFLCGFIDNRTNPKTAFMFTNICCVVACILNIIPTTPTLIISLVFIGIGTGGSANFIMSMTTEYWGRFKFIKAYPTVLTINQLLGSAGPMLMAVIAAKAGWDMSYIVMAILGVVATLIAIPIKKGFVEKAEEKFAAEANGVVKQS
ncbi:sugar phosphate permease [Clostridium sp. SY8519]|uniref:MFS transporter n=1 Tax=Clostridium sp. (strain SY8519) TaxID=1042156 RepID=UPI0002171B5A|nr:MFS transporter [Clostridium sp. SY8519]BAK47566.1 sugar phosphate permease [Clostridium sp. SY8519]